MIEFTIETVIDRPISEVFAYVTDPTKLVTWQTNTVSVTPEETGPLGLGTRLREVHRTPGGKELTSLVEVSEYEPDRAFALQTIEGSLPIHARITFETTPRSAAASSRAQTPVRRPLRDPQARPGGPPSRARLHALTLRRRCEAPLARSTGARNRQPAPR
jgi:uncharacterized protein YndB with AHSA1/START domain